MVLHTTNFVYNNAYYSQTLGTTMSSPISPTLANLMEELENAVLIKLEYVGQFFKKYVDYCIICISENQLNNTHSVLNSFHLRIQITMEK